MPDNENQKRLKAQIHETTELLINIMSQPSLPPALGLDLDGCIDEAHDFFRTLAQVWPGEVFVITYRTDQAKAEQDVAKFGTRRMDRKPTWQSARSRPGTPKGHVHTDEHCGARQYRDRLRRPD